MKEPMPKFAGPKNAPHLVSAKRLIGDALEVQLPCLSFDQCDIARKAFCPVKPRDTAWFVVYKMIYR